MSPEEAYAILEAIAKISGATDRLHRVTPTGDEIKAEETAAEIKTEARWGPFRFSMIGLEPGSEISFYNDEAITATVVDDRSIRYGDEVMSLSKAAAIALGDESRSVAGPMYWKYKGKSLAEIRNEMGL